MKGKKQKFALWIYPSTMETIERYLESSECRSKSDFIEKGILFYAGFLSAQTYQDYLPNVVVSCMKGTLGSFERRTSNILLKVAVKLSMMNFLLASTHRVSRETMDSLRNMCNREVKSYNGSSETGEANSRLNTKTGRSNDLPVVHPTHFPIRNTEQIRSGIFFATSHFEENLL